MEFNFTTIQGKDAKVIVEPRDNGEVSVREFYLEGKQIYKAQKGNFGWCELRYAYNDKSEKAFCMKIKKDVCKKYLEINNIKANAKEGNVKIDNKDLENLYNEWPKQVKREKEIEAEKYYQEYKKENKKINVYYSTSIGFRVKNKEIENSTDVKKMEQVISENLPKDELEKYLTETDWGDYSITYYYELTISDLEYILEKAKEIDLEETLKRDKLREEKEKEKQKIFTEAKETGEKQKLYSYSEPCNDRNEECDIDIITVYALPNGDTEEVRSHTW